MITSTTSPTPYRCSPTRSEQRLTLSPHRAMAGHVADLLVDTDVFVDHLRGAQELEAKRHRLHYSVVTRAELFAGSTASDLSAQLLAPFREIQVDRAIAERAGRIAREFGTRLPDALIAATALEAAWASSPATANTSYRSVAFVCEPSFDIAPVGDRSGWTAPPTRQVRRPLSRRRLRARTCSRALGS